MSQLSNGRPVPSGRKNRHSPAIAATVPSSSPPVGNSGFSNGIETQAKLRSLNADGHRSKLFSYNDAREQIARLAMRAHDEAIQLAAKAKEEAGWEAEAQAEAEAARLEREAKLARARGNIASITATAGGNSPTDPVWIKVTAAYIRENEHAAY